MLRHKGVPEPLITYVKDLYDTSTTRVIAGTKVSDPIEVKRGVKQGDPLSPFLFNLVLDICLGQLGPLSGAPLRNKGTRVSHLAFADDVVLLATNGRNLQRLLAKYTSSLARIGLKVNAAKCNSYKAVVTRDRNGSKWVISPSPCLNINGEEIPPLARGDLYRYLGVHVGVDRKTEHCDLAAWTSTNLERWLGRLTSAPLKPTQRVRMLVDHLLPRLDHMLALTDIQKGLLK